MLGLLLVTALAAGPGMAGPQLGTLGQPSPVVGLVDFTAGFGSASWYGAPAPTIDCTAAASGGDLTCTGATASKSGSPTTVGSPWWPSSAGWSGVQQKAVSLAGSEYFGLGDVGDQTTALTACAVFSNDSIATADQVIFGKDTTGGRSWLMYRSTATLTAVACKAGTTCSTLNLGTLTAGAWNVACFSYLYVADGTSVIRGNLNGVAPPPSSTAVGPIADVATEMTVGAWGGGGLRWAGKIARTSLFSGWAASASELDSLTKSQLGLLATKPAGTVLSHSRSDATLCGPYPDNLYYWLAPNVPCILPTSGIEVYGRAYNNVYYSEAFDSWSALGNTIAAPVVTPNSADVTDPLGGTTAEKVVFPTYTGTGYSILRNSPNIALGAKSLGVWARTLTGTARFRLQTSTSGNLSTLCSVTTTWARCHVETSSGSDAAAPIDIGYNSAHGDPSDPGGGGTVYLWGASANAGPVLLPYRAALGGTAYDGGAGSATTLSVPGAIPAGKWAISLSGDPAHNWNDSTDFRAWSGAGNLFAKVGSGTGYFSVVDGGAAQRYTTWTAPAHSNAATLRCEADGAGALKTYLDGVDVSSSTSTLGITTSTPATLYIGAASDGSQSFAGAVSRFVQCRKGGNQCK